MSFCAGGVGKQLVRETNPRAYDKLWVFLTPILWEFVIIGFLTLGFPFLVVASPHQTSKLEIPLQGGAIPQTMTFPLYEQEGIRYFSAGVGKEERELSYPPYSLKLILVQGERAFLAGVSFEIHKEDGSTAISIPAEEIQGPWVFINAPKGKYSIKATSSSGKTLERKVEIKGNASSVVHFRWP